VPDCASWGIGAFVTRTTIAALALSALAGCSSTADEPKLQDGPLSTEADANACVTGPGVTTLYAGTVKAMAVAGKRVVILGDSLLSVPLAGGAPTVLANPTWAERLFAIGDTAYYEEHSPTGGLAPGSGGYPLMAVPTAGGTAHEFLSALPALFPFGKADDTSYYFTSSGAVGGAALSRLTPPSTDVVPLTTERFIASSLAPVRDDVYFISSGLSPSANGHIGRLSKQGGKSEQVVPDVGMATNLVADASGLYWIQPQSRWADGVRRGNPYTLAHAALDGTSVDDSLAEDPRALAVADGVVYFTTSSEVKSVTADGLAKTIASDQGGPMMLAVSGRNLVWMTGFQGAPDGGITIPALDAGSAPSLGDGSVSGPSRVVTACIPK
jgi:hypothetical protein